MVDFFFTNLTSVGLVSSPVSCITFQMKFYLQFKWHAEVLQSIRDGRNVCFTGEAGTGKTILLKLIKEFLEEREPSGSILTFAMVGAAAVLVVLLFCDYFKILSTSLSLVFVYVCTHKHFLHTHTVSKPLLYMNTIHNNFLSSQTYPYIIEIYIHTHAYDQFLTDSSQLFNVSKEFQTPIPIHTCTHFFIHGYFLED